MRLLIAGTLAILGLSALPVQAQQVSSTQVNALVEAFRKAAPQTGRANDGLYSDWQVKPENIPRWSRFCTGKSITPAQFEANPTQARQIMTCIIGDLFKDEYKASQNNEQVAVLRSAAWWMTGDATQYNRGSTASYAQQVLKFYQQQRSQR